MQQISQTDEVKDEKAEAKAFSLIWDACSNMDGYVQMHFSSDIRETIFSKSWNEFPPDNILSKLKQENNKDTKVCTLEEIISGRCSNDETGSQAQADYVQYFTDSTDIQYKSFVDFPHFLLYTLNVYFFQKKQPEKTINVLDEQKIIKIFSDEIKESCTFSEEFIVCLLQTRFLFDKFILKRDFDSNALNEDGKWSLKSMPNNEDRAKNNYECVNTFTNNENILMLQACLRVSYTNPKEMSWITEILRYLNKQLNSLPSPLSIEAEDDEKKIEDIIKTPVKEFLEPENNKQEKTKEKYELGVKTPHIVFNYLDYLLWRDRNTEENAIYKNLNFDNFVFKYRNSVEHWYPQNPPRDSFEKWLPEDGLNQFGNLALLPSNINAKFSNAEPEGKNHLLVILQREV